MKRIPTAAEVKAKFEDVKQRFAQLESAWEASEHRDKQALTGMLLFYRTVLPEVLASGLLEALTPRRTMHHVRHEHVKSELAQNPTLTVRQACARVSKKLAKAPARGKTTTIERSFYKIKNQQQRQTRQRRKRQPSNLTVSKG